MAQDTQPTVSDHAAAAAEHARGLLEQGRAAIEGLVRDGAAEALARLAQSRPEAVATLPRDIPVAERTVAAACTDASTALAHAFDLLASFRLAAAWDAATLAFGGCLRAIHTAMTALIT